ncbi:MAG: hypothetical protein QXU93_11670 [Thermoproteus sp.]
MELAKRQHYLYLRTTPQGLMKLREKDVDRINRFIGVRALGFHSAEEFIACIKDDKCLEEILRNICNLVALGCHNLSLTSNRSYYICKGWKVFCVEKGYL